MAQHVDEEGSYLPTISTIFSSTASTGGVLQAFFSCSSKHPHVVPRNNPFLSHIASTRGRESAHSAGAIRGGGGGGIGTSRARSIGHGVRLRSTMQHWEM